MTLLFEIGVDIDYYFMVLMHNKNLRIIVTLFYYEY